VTGDTDALETAPVRVLVRPLITECRVRAARRVSGTLEGVDPNWMAPVANAARYPPSDDTARPDNPRLSVPGASGIGRSGVTNESGAGGGEVCGRGALTSAAGSGRQQTRCAPR